MSGMSLYACRDNVSTDSIHGYLASYCHRAVAVVRHTAHTTSRTCHTLLAANIEHAHACSCVPYSLCYTRCAEILPALVTHRKLPSVSAAVRPYLTFLDSVETNKHIFKILSPSGSHTILVFPYRTLWQ